MNTQPKRSILLAEDDSDDTFFFFDFLHHRTDADLLPGVTNGVEVLDYLSSIGDNDLPDVIILDQNMPKLSGIEALKAIRSNARYARIAIVMYSTYVGPQLADECLTLGATSVETKPLNRAGYNAMIDGILSRL